MAPHFDVRGYLSALALEKIPARDHQVIDARGKYLMPGGIDVHTHLELPFGGTVSSDDFCTGHAAAAFGGTTTHIDFVIQPKGGSLHDGLKDWHRKADPKAQEIYARLVKLGKEIADIKEETKELSEEFIAENDRLRLELTESPIVTEFIESQKEYFEMMKELQEKLRLPS